MHHVGMLCPPHGLCLVNDLKAHLRHHRQVIIEGSPSFWRDRHRVTRQRVIASSPVARPTTHRHSRQEYGLTSLSSTFYTLRDNNCGGRHDHLKAILDCFTTLEK